MIMRVVQELIPSSPPNKEMPNLFTALMIELINEFMDFDIYSPSIPPASPLPTPVSILSIPLILKIGKNLRAHSLHIFAL